MISQRFKVFLCAIFLAIAFTWSSRLIQESSRAKFTSIMCESVANYLETGSLRPAYEVMSFSTSRMYPGSCVTIADQGRKFSPACIDTVKSYETHSCLVAGNKGVRAEAHYPISRFFSMNFILIAATIFSISLMLMTALSKFAAAIRKEMDQSVARLFENQTQPASLSDRILRTVGASNKIQANTQNLERSISAFKLKLKREAELRAIQDEISERNNNYISKAVQIRHDMAAPIGALISLKPKLQTDFAATQMMNESIRRLKLMMDDLSTVTRETFFLRPELIQAVVDEVVSHLSPQIDSSRTKIIVQSQRHDIIAAIDAEKMKRLLTNLIINAIEASAKVIIIKVDSKSDLVQIDLIDNGTGVPAEIRHALFKKGSSYGKPAGNGLGLYYAKETLRAWHGDVEIEHLTVGTKLRIRLPTLSLDPEFSQSADHSYQL